MSGTDKPEKTAENRQFTGQEARNAGELSPIRPQVDLIDIKERTLIGRYGHDEEPAAQPIQLPACQPALLPNRSCDVEHLTAISTQSPPAADDLDLVLHNLLASVEPETSRRLRALARPRRFAAGEVIAADGMPAREIGFVIDGVLGMIKVLPDGRRHVIGLLVPTDLYGRLFDGPMGYSIVALDAARCLTFDRDDFEGLLREEPALERRILVSVIDELDAAREWLMLISGRKVVERVAALLVILSRRKARLGARTGGPLRVRLPIPRTELAHYLGTRPESLSRAFHALERERLIKIIDPYLFDIRDIGGLVEASGLDLTLD